MDHDQKKEMTLSTHPLVGRNGTSNSTGREKTEGLEIVRDLGKKRGLKKRHWDTTELGGRNPEKQHKTLDAAWGEKKRCDCWGRAAGACRTKMR